jgi:hypothetical protein
MSSPWRGDVFDRQHCGVGDGVVVGLPCGGTWFVHGGRLKGNGAAATLPMAARSDIWWYVGGDGVRTARGYNTAATTLAQ